MNLKVFRNFLSYVKFRFAEHVFASIAIIILSLWKIIESLARILWFIPCIIIEFIMEIIYAIKTKKEDKTMDKV